jgi:glutamate/tyrosine decarboxylase-like PLP-dependent enzyme
MPHKAESSTFDPYTNSVQWSRRFIGLKLFLSLAQHGEAGHAEMIDRQTRMGQLLREALIASGWRIVNSSPLPLLCFTRDGLDITRFLESMREHQVAWMSEARIAGTPVIRACITSFRTTERDIFSVVDEMNRLVAQAAVDLAGHALYSPAHATSSL